MLHLCYICSNLDRTWMKAKEVLKRYAAGERDFRRAQSPKIFDATLKALPDKAKVVDAVSFYRWYSKP